MDISFKRFDIFSYVSEDISSRFNEFIDESELKELGLYLQAMIILLENIEDINPEYAETSEILFNEMKSQIDENVTKYEIFLLENELKHPNFFDDFLSKHQKIEYRNPYDLKSCLLNYFKFVTLLSEKIYTNYPNFFEKLTEQIRSFSFHPRNSGVLFGKSYDKFGFFSYAYLDRIYTLGIFLVFLDNNTLLYLDWIFNDQRNDGIVLKQQISSIMPGCDFILFLRTVNSELKTKGNHHIRQWCSWEIGNFYQYSSEARHKFCINTLDNSITNNLMLEDFIFISKITEYKSYY